MATAITPMHADVFAECLRSDRWQDVISHYRQVLTSEERQADECVLPYAIALVRSGKVGSGISLLHQHEGLISRGRDLLRRYLISFLVRENRFDEVISILDKLIEADPESIDDLRLRGSVYGRNRQFEPAIRDARRVIALSPDDWAGHVSLLKLLVRAGFADDAADHVQSLGASAASDPQLADMALLVLERAGRYSQAQSWADAAEQAGISNAVAAAAVVRAYLVGGDLEKAVSSGERLLGIGFDCPQLRQHLAAAILENQDQDPKRLERVVDLLQDIARGEAADLVLLSNLARALMRLGRSEEAVPVLEQAVGHRPDATGIRALLARALRQSGRFAEAAREFKRLLPAHPGSHNFHRYAAGALSLAGKEDEAARVFGEFVATRRGALPDDFEAGLEALWDRVEGLELPSERLEWAWHLRGDQNADRQTWERRAKWGHLADHYFLDWLECRDDKIHEAMRRLAELGDAERALMRIDRSRGVVLASAHVGPMYAGPLALELMGIGARWLASTPSSVRTSYGRSLISTSDQSGAEVARQTMRTLSEGKAVAIAIDGAISLSAPRVHFEGQDVTFSSFASRMAHRLKIPSLFVAPRWQEGRIGFVLKSMPDPLPGENADAHAKRWQDAFLAELREYLAGAPENLRLSGGIWRHLRPLRT